MKIPRMQLAELFRLTEKAENLQSKILDPRIRERVEIAKNNLLNAIRLAEDS